LGAPLGGGAAAKKGGAGCARTRFGTMGKAKAKAKESTKTKVKKTEKVIEDKTFGLKNKNKSKKVQQYIQQVQQSAGGGRGRGRQLTEADLAKRKKEKEAKLQAEKEMLAMLGDAYGLEKKKKKVKKKEAEAIAQEQEEEMEKQRVADEKDFGTPICPLRDVFGQGSKVMVERVCVELVWKDNLPGKAFDGSPCLFLKVNDGTTLNPMTMCLIGETPTTFDFKVNMVLDVRGAIAMVRGDKVLLELPKGTQGLSNAAEGVTASMEVASERLTEFVREKIVEEEEIRERGGIPIEERIEEERAMLQGPLTPVTKERFFEWKAKKLQAKKEKAEQESRESNKKGQKQMLSGRALFLMDQSLFVDDSGAMGAYERRADDDLDNDDEALTDADDLDDDDDGGDTSASAKPPAPPITDGADAAASAIQEKLYLEGDDDLDDLDDLDDSDDE